MQLYPILIVAIVLAADGLSLDGGTGAGLAGWQVTAAAFGVPLAALVLTWLFIVAAMRRSHSAHSVAPVLWAHRVSRAVRGLLLVHHAVMVLGLGWLTVIRSWTGDLILIDELIAMSPPLLGVIGSWWVEYPIEKRLRDAMLIRRLDQGEVVYPTPGRAAHVLMQLRLQMLPLLVPLLMIAAFGEVIRIAAQGVADEDARFWIGEGATLVAAAMVFLIAPVLARLLLSVRRLDDGPTRELLLDVCRRHGVRVREILIWNTGGVMINAAVMGLVAPLRYVLLTDALLDAMDRRQLVAVMAHEIGHIRRHHMPWMIVALLASLAAASMLVTLPITLFYMVTEAEFIYTRSVEMGATATALFLAFVSFGWVSRRLERQADTFAAQHLSTYELPDVCSNHDELTGATPFEEDATNAVTSTQRDEPPGAITSEAAQALRSALRTIARLNMIDPARKSWRHGSINWRQEYLESIVGNPADRLPIDRVVRRLKVGAAAVLLAAVALHFLLPFLERSMLDTNWMNSQTPITELADDQRSESL